MCEQNKQLGQQIYRKTVILLPTDGTDKWTIILFEY